MSSMRGYFGIGAEGTSKPANIGALLRTAHAFGASFVFTVGAVADPKAFRVSDTAATERSLPLYAFPDAASLTLPRGCRLVGIELMDDAIDLPSFGHPRQAAYILGPEKGGLSPEIVARCDHVVKIPMRFSINLSLAGALVMYDRMIHLGRFPPRPVRPGAPTEPVPVHIQGGPVIRARIDAPIHEEWQEGGGIE